MSLSNIDELWRPEPGSDLALIPCPFCGGTTVVYFRYKHRAGDRYGVLCCDCMANIDPGWARQKSAVQPLWNRRTVDDVEVVRCRNCKYYKLDEHSLGSEGKPLHYCDRDGGLDWFISGDMFCSYGENCQ